MVAAADIADPAARTYDITGEATHGHTVMLTAADFAELAKKYSEDSSFDRGGDLGSIGRGMFAAPYEDAAFALAKPGDTSAVVETDFGFHVIRRLD